VRTTKHISEEEAWELYKEYSENIEPYLLMVDIKVIPLDLAKQGVEQAKDFLSTLGNSYEEMQFRSILEGYTRMYQCLFKDRVSLEDLLIEKAYPTNVEAILEGGIRALQKKLDKAF
jgi:hypothetical protein